MNEDVKRMLEAACVQPGEMGLSVFELSQFVFCRRAGVCTHETPKEDRVGMDNECWPGTYAPDYTIDHINRELYKAIGQFALLLGGAVGLALLTLLFHRWDIYYLDPLSAPVVAILAGFALHRLWWVLQEHRKKQLALGGPAREPNRSADRPQPVVWWSLLKARFVPRICREPLDDPSLNLAGRPDLLLERDDLCIPVWYHRTESEATRGKLFNQHMVRMTAYCHLVQVSMGKSSPYGIVLFDNTNQGMTVPCNPDNMELFLRSLIEARRVAAVAKRGENIPPPENLNVCSGCSLAKPVKLEEGKLFWGRSAYLQMFVLKSQGKPCTYHCHCGDRFEWFPRHADAEKLNLIRLV